MTVKKESKNFAWFNQHQLDNLDSMCVKLKTLKEKQAKKR